MFLSYGIKGRQGQQQGHPEATREIAMALWPSREMLAQVIMKGDKEIVGTLRGFDDYVNMVMDVHGSVLMRGAGPVSRS